MFLDAYTIRKAIPRIVIAVIGINLSIYLCVAVVDIINLVGNGLGNLITAPFLNGAWHDVTLAGNKTNYIAGVGLILGIVGTVGGIAAIGGGIGAVGLAFAGGALGFLSILLPFLITVGLIMLSIIFTLVIRQAIIIFCVVISPVAIALFVLPGTEKYFKSWWGLFTKALLVYPIVAALFAMSTVMTTIILGTADLSPGAIGFTKILAAIVVAFAPLVMIPFAFKMAGGALSAVMNAGANQSRTLAGSARKGLDRMKQDPNSLYGKAINRNRDARFERGVSAGQVFSGLSSRARGGSYRAASRAVNTDRSMRRFEEIDKLDAMQPVKNNDDFLNALRFAKTEAETHRYLSNLEDDDGNKIYKGAALDAGVASVTRARGVASHEELARYAAVQNVSTGTAYAKGQGEMLQAINMAAGDDRVMAASMLAKARSLAPAARRPDLAGGGFGQNLGELETLHAAGNSDAAAAAATVRMDEASLDANGAAQFAYARPGVIKRMAPMMAERVNNTIKGKDEKEIMQSLAATAGMHDSLSAVSPEAAREMANRVMSKEVEISSLPDNLRDMLATNPDGTRTIRDKITIHEAIEASRGNGYFQQMRKEFARLNDAAAAAATTPPPTTPGPPSPPTGGPPTGP